VRARNRNHHGLDLLVDFKLTRLTTSSIARDTSARSATCPRRIPLQGVDATPSIDISIGPSGKARDK